MVFRLLLSLSLLNYFSLLRGGDECGLFCVRLFRPLWPPNLGGSCGCSDLRRYNLGGSSDCSDPQPPNLGGETF